ncbi:hypothetical protein AABB24_039408 [Solanum stoloniferum]|uniref:Uncharacterized protein n=1 Tax=Solanum stoloniferum TaxID=62892 RepID=A0ABD2QQH4_9SOLN
MLKRLHSLKGMKNNTKCIDSSSIDNENNLMVVVNVLREVRVATMSILESLMALMSMPNPNATRKSSKGYFSSKLLMRVNSLSSWEKCDAMTLQCANKRLEAVELAIENFEGELECIIRRLIRTRASLLNLLTY